MGGGVEYATPLGPSPAQVAFDIGYGLVTYEGTGLLTTYGHPGWEPPPLSPTLLRRGEKSFAPHPERGDRPLRDWGIVNSHVAPDEGRPAGRPSEDIDTARGPLSPGSRPGQALTLPLHLFDPSTAGTGERFFAPTRNVILPLGRWLVLRRGDACVAPPTSGLSRYLGA